jgi:hypothetical protein
MKPGEDGGSEPFTCFFLRRSRKQHPRRRAAAPTKPIGTPTPSPIFWFLVSPVSLAGGEAGSFVALEEAVLVFDDLDEELLDLDTVEDPIVDASLKELADDLVEVDNVEAEDRVALLRSVADVEDISCKDRAVLDDGHRHSDCVGVACASVVCGGAGSHAVDGPNSLIK